MKKIICLLPTLIALSLTALALDPLLPVRHIETGDEHGQLPTLFNGEEVVEAEWENFTPVVVSPISTNSVPIPAEVIQVAEEYKAIMESNLGTGSHTNRVFTREMVTLILFTSPTFDRDLGDDLNFAYEIITGFNRQVGLPSNGYDYPFGASNVTVVVTNAPGL